MDSNDRLRQRVLIIGSSRGLGYAMAEEFLKRGWDVIGTVRGPARTELHELAERAPGRVRIETLDVTHAEQMAGLRARLAD